MTSLTVLPTKQDVKAVVAVGTKFGRYEVVKHLTRGGMADLCVARARGIEGFERHVVIKHLRAEESEDATFVRMFLTEARLAGALHHHNIVQVHDIGQDIGRHFFAMEYVHGEDLRRFLRTLKERGQQTPIEHVVTIIMAVASALHHAHEQKGSDRQPLGIIHRDISPGNIIVGYDGNVKVVDFGIAKAALRKGEANTKTGMLKGKVPYMSPEQCTSQVLDRRSDLFSVGILLYELVTVRRLFKGGNEHKTMSAVIGADIPPPSQFRDDLPKPLEAIILKALSRAPADRYQTAEELRVALDDFAAKAGLRTSTSALASFMKQLYGERPEPWMADDQRVRPEVDFDAPDEVSTSPDRRTPPGKMLNLNMKPPATPKAAPVPGSTSAPKSLRPLVNHRSPKTNGASTPPPLPPPPNDEPTEQVSVDMMLLAAGAATPSPPTTTATEPLLVIEATSSTSDVTAVVTPLAFVPEPAGQPEVDPIIGPPIDPPIGSPIDEDTHGVSPPRFPRTWLFGGAIGAVAIIVAIVIASTSSSSLPVPPARPVVEVKPAVEPAPAIPEPEPIDPAIPEPKAVAEVKPTVEPPAVVAPAPAEPEVALTPSEPTPAPSPIIHKPNAVRPKPKAVKPTPKPPTPEPTWDPNALFLKKR